MELENPAESPCWGCGPRHPRGLHLRFEREGDEVRTTYTPRDDEVGWPGLFHTGLHYTVAYEACYWAALELGGAVCIPKGPQVWDQQRLPPTGRPFVVRARLRELAAEGPRVLARSEAPDGRLFATLEAGFRFSSRSVVERSGLKVPDYLLREMKP